MEGEVAIEYGLVPVAAVVTDAGLLWSVAGDNAHAVGSGGDSSFCQSALDGQPLLEDAGLCVVSLPIALGGVAGGLHAFG